MLIIGQQKSQSSHFRWFLPLGVPLFLVWLFLAVMAVIGVLHPHRQGNDPREVAEQDNRGGKSSHFRGFLPLGVPLFLSWLFLAVMAVIGVLLLIRQGNDPREVAEQGQDDRAKAAIYKA